MDKHVKQTGENSFRIETNESQASMPVIVETFSNSKVSMLMIGMEDNSDDIFLTVNEQIALRDILNHLHPIDSTPQI